MTGARPIRAAEAADAISIVETVRARTRASVAYRLASDKLIWWGGIVALADVSSRFAPASAGLVGSALIGRRLARLGFLRMWRMYAGVAPFLGFGLFWSLVVGRFEGRQMAAFWPSCVMFCYALAGLWLGRVYIVLGVGLAALIAVGYLFSGRWFSLYLAVVNSAGLIACGLWTKRA